MRRHAMPITLDELCSQTDSIKKKIGKIYKKICRVLGIKMEVRNPEDFMNKLAYDLELNPDVLFLARKLLNRYLKIKYRSSRAPKGLAVGCLYCSSILKRCSIPQTNFTKDKDVTEVTVRTVCKDIVGSLHLEKRFNLALSKRAKNKVKNIKVKKAKT